MINNSRKFAITWLLEPTKKLEEVQYEYVFRLITFPIDKQTFLVYKHVLNNGSIMTIETETPTNLPIIQANLYKKTSQGRNHIGTVEYFSCQKYEIEDSYQTGTNPNGTPQIERIIKYAYFLRGTSSFSLREIAKRTEYTCIPDAYGVGIDYEATYVNTYQPDIFTAEFFSFSEKTYCKLNSNGNIAIFYVSYPSYEETQITTITGPSPVSQEDVFTRSGKTNISVSFNACGSNLDNLDDYQSYLNTTLDNELSLKSSTLVKCSNGLTFDGFMAIAQETQYFSKNTTIIFEHD